MKLKTELLRLNKRDLRGELFLSLDLNEIAEKLRTKKIFVYRDFDHSKVRGLVESIEIVDNVLYADIELFDEENLGSLAFAFGGIATVKKRIDECKMDLSNAILTEVGLLEQNNVAPYLEAENV